MVSILTLAIVFSPLPSTAATKAAAPDSALQACVAASTLHDDDAAKKSAQAAERHYRTLLSAHPDDRSLKTLLARVLSQCVIERVSIFSKEGVVKESNHLLLDVLAQDSTDWGSRYALALNYYHAPAFFGWTDKSIAEFEHLLAQQGNQTYFPEQAMPFLYLGNLYEKKGRKADAKAIWQRGSQLFPSNDKLRAKMSGSAP